MKHRTSIAIVSTLLIATSISISVAARPNLFASQDTAGSEASAQKRAVLYVNRSTTIMGYVELDEDDMIIVRDREDELHSYPKSRVRAIVYLVDPQEGGQPGTVLLRNGQRRDGIIHEDAFDHVVVEIEGIRTKLRRDVVASVTLHPTVMERYQTFKARMNPDNLQQHFDLCNWLVEHKMWELADTELKALLKKEQAGEALKLQRLVKAQLALMKAKTEGSDEKGEASRTSDTSSDEQATPRENRRSRDDGPTRLLDDTEINLIRVYELDFNDPPRLHIRPDVIRQMISEYSSNELIPIDPDRRNALFRADALDIVRLMFALKARHLYGQIEVLSDPPSIQQFHRYVHDAWLVRNCATSGCHGGGDGGRLQLHRRGANSDRVRYTNMMILERLELEGAEQPLLNYDDPSMSLLIQHALPRTLARLPHPEVDGWRPIFTRGNKELLQSSMDWMRGMLKPRPQYPIDFDPNKRAGDEIAEEKDDPAID